VNTIFHFKFNDKPIRNAVLAYRAIYHCDLGHTCNCDEVDMIKTIKGDDSLKRTDIYHVLPQLSV